MPGALHQTKVLDLSRYIAGPYCAQLLGDLGADVVKVERFDGGEEGRRIGDAVGTETLFFMSANRNKRSLTLDFRNPESQALLRRLAGEADILIENFRPGTMEKMGCGWDELSAINPRLVMVRITGFGQDGPLAQHPCFDGAAQALGGIMSMTGQPDGRPTMAGVFVCDYTTAIYGALAAVAALQARERTGRGQVVEATLLDSALSMLTTAIPEKALFDREPDRLGNRDRYLAPSHCFSSQDGVWIYVVAGNDHHFARLADAMEMPDLKSDKRFSNYLARNAHVAELEHIIDHWGQTLTGDQIFERLRKADIPCERLSTIADLLDHPHLKDRQQIVDVPHPDGGTVPFQAPPFRLSDTPESIRHGAPALGDHSQDVLQEWLGLSPHDVSDLRSENII
ncbi:MAG: CoA transferase [Pseudomonadota bacterium]